jgi:hypothetical protein
MALAQHINVLARYYVYLVVPKGVQFGQAVKLLLLLRRKIGEIF